jgi:hypothetical protein
MPSQDLKSRGIILLVQALSRLLLFWVKDAMTEMSFQLQTDVRPVEGNSKMLSLRDENVKVSKFF